MAQGWTDQNNAEGSAAYMIRVAHNEWGYINPSVRATQDGNKRVFEVEPGRIYHVKELRVVGRGGLPAEAMADAPASGEIYSAARMDDWMTIINNPYGPPGKLGSHIRSRKGRGNDRSETRPRQLWQAHTAASMTWPLVDRQLSHYLIPTLDWNDKR